MWIGACGASTAWDIWYRQTWRSSTLLESTPKSIEKANPTIGPIWNGKHFRCTSSQGNPVFVLCKDEEHRRTDILQHLRLLLDITVCWVIVSLFFVFLFSFVSNLFFMQPCFVSRGKSNCAFHA
jgi:hypothetical protein